MRLLASVRHFARINLRTAERISVKFVTGEFY